MDGAKPYILPAIAALLLVGYFVFRPALPDPDGGGEGPEPSLDGLHGRDAVEAAVREAAPADGLAPATQDYTTQAIGSVVHECRNQTGTLDGQLKIRVTVVAAENLGGHILDAEIEPEPTTGLEGLAACVRSGLGKVTVDAPIETQRGSIAGVY